MVFRESFSKNLGKYLWDVPQKYNILYHIFNWIAICNAKKIEKIGKKI